MDCDGILAASWETIPSEQQVQELFATEALNWKEHKINHIVDYWYPAYLKEFGWEIDGYSYDSETIVNNLEDYTIYKVHKYLSRGVPRRSFLINYNESQQMTPFNDFRIHGEVVRYHTKDQPKEEFVGTVFEDDVMYVCMSCIQNHPDEVAHCNTVQFHAWYTDEWIFMDNVLKFKEHYFCAFCNGFLYELHNHGSCVVCEHIVEYNDAYTFTSL